MNLSEQRLRKKIKDLEKVLTAQSMAHGYEVQALDHKLKTLSGGAKNFEEAVLRFVHDLQRCYGSGSEAKVTKIGLSPVLFEQVITDLLRNHPQTSLMMLNEIQVYGVHVVAREKETF